MAVISSRPPPRVVPPKPPSHLFEPPDVTDSIFSDAPKLSDWRKLGYPSEYAYAKDLGMLKDKGIVDVVNKSNLSENLSFNAPAPVKNTANTSQPNYLGFDEDVEMKMRELEMEFQSMLANEDHAKDHQADFKGAKVIPNVVTTGIQGVAVARASKSPLRGKGSGISSLYGNPDDLEMKARKQAEYADQLRAQQSYVGNSQRTKEVAPDPYRSVSSGLEDAQSVYSHRIPQASPALMGDLYGAQGYAWQPPEASNAARRKVQDVGAPDVGMGAMLSKDRDSEKELKRQRQLEYKRQLDMQGGGGGGRAAHPRGADAHESEQRHPSVSRPPRETDGFSQGSQKLLKKVQQDEYRRELDRQRAIKHDLQEDSRMAVRNAPHEEPAYFERRAPAPSARQAPAQPVAQPSIDADYYRGQQQSYEPDWGQQGRSYNNPHRGAAPRIPAGEPRLLDKLDIASMSDEMVEELYHRLKAEQAAAAAAGQDRGYYANQQQLQQQHDWDRAQSQYESHVSRAPAPSKVSIEVPVTFESQGAPRATTPARARGATDLYGRNPLVAAESQPNAKWRPSNQDSNSDGKRNAAAQQRAILDQQMRERQEAKKKEKEDQQREDEKFQQQVRQEEEAAEAAKQAEKEKLRVQQETELRKAADLRRVQEEEALLRKNKRCQQVEQRAPERRMSHDHYPQERVGADGNWVEAPAEPVERPYDPQARPQQLEPSRQYQSAGADGPYDAAGKSPAKSPTAARNRLVADVYGSSNMLAHNSAQAHDSWRPSKVVNERAKASQRAHQDALRQQIEENKRAQQEEKDRLKKEEEDLRRKEEEAAQREKDRAVQAKQQVKDDARRREAARQEPAANLRGSDKRGAGSPLSSMVEESDERKRQQRQQQHQSPAVQQMENFLEKDSVDSFMAHYQKHSPARNKQHKQDVRDSYESRDADAAHHHSPLRNKGHGGGRRHHQHHHYEEEPYEAPRGYPPAYPRELDYGPPPYGYPPRYSQDHPPAAYRQSEERYPPAAYRQGEERYPPAAYRQNEERYAPAAAGYYEEHHHPRHVQDVRRSRDIDYQGRNSVDDSPAIELRSRSSYLPANPYSSHGNHLLNSMLPVGSSNPQRLATPDMEKSLAGNSMMTYVNSLNQQQRPPSSHSEPPHRSHSANPAAQQQQQVAGKSTSAKRDNMKGILGGHDPQPSRSVVYQHPTAAEVVQEPAGKPSNRIVVSSKAAGDRAEPFEAHPVTSSRPQSGSAAGIGGASRPSSGSNPAYVSQFLQHPEMQQRLKTPVLSDAPPASRPTSSYSRGPVGEQSAGGDAQSRQSTAAKSLTSNRYSQEQFYDEHQAAPPEEREGTRSGEVEEEEEVAVIGRGHRAGLHDANSAYFQAPAAGGSAKASGGGTAAGALNWERDSAESVGAEEQQHRFNPAKHRKNVVTENASLFKINANANVKRDISLDSAPATKRTWGVSGKERVHQTRMTNEEDEEPLDNEWEPEI